mmetsp:Transcript_2998/g.6429  ORF Transcript_2998/g.6429 Transcript_2998/m.6429 type:complete len:208 (-) Transcript_2998:565-1188(-)
MDQQRGRLRRDVEQRCPLMQGDLRQPAKRLEGCRHDQLFGVGKSLQNARQHKRLQRSTTDKRANAVDLLEEATTQHGVPVIEECDEEGQQQIIGVLSLHKNTEARDISQHQTLDGGARIWVGQQLNHDPRDLLLQCRELFVVRPEPKLRPFCPGAELSASQRNACTRISATHPLRHLEKSAGSLGEACNGRCECTTHHLLRIASHAS